MPESPKPEAASSMSSGETVTLISRLEEGNLGRKVGNIRPTKTCCRRG